MTRSMLPPLSPNAWLRYDLIERLFPPGINDVLEIGCGRGGVAARFARRARYVGLEPDTVSCEAARRAMASSGGDGTILQADLSALPADQRFDLVCAFEVLEHIEDDRAALAEWTARLRPGGWLLISTPAHQHRFAAADVMAGHFRRYDPPVMVERLKGAGLSDVAVCLYGMPLGYLLEAGRNVVGRRHAKRELSMAERTSGSGRLLQPTRPVTGLATRAITAPFRRLQRAFPQHGPGLVARGRLASG